MKGKLSRFFFVVVACASLAGCRTPPATAHPLSALPDAAARVLLAEVDSAFTAGGEPIHAKLISEFEGWRSDGGPITLKVDLTNALAADDEYYEPHVTTGENSEGLDGWWTRWTDEGEWPRESFYYYRVGRLADGTHVLRTSYSGGGSGQFGGISFVRAFVEPIGATGRWRVALETRGTHGIGDRTGRLITVEADHVVVGQSAPGVPGPHRTEEVTIIRPW